MTTLSLVDAARRLSLGTLRARDYVETLLERIGRVDDDILAWATLDAARARAVADTLDAARAASTEVGPLFGVPVGVKDIIDTADLPTQMGSPLFTGHYPAQDAAIVATLASAGGFVLGKTVTTEVAFMHPGKTRNPWNPDHTPGGSSSGSAAAVAAGCVPGAIGTQTNGSVIRPAAYCGIVGFKPTSGLLPWGGALQFSATLDQMGTFARSVDDAAWLTAPLAGGEVLAQRVAMPGGAPRIGVLERFPWSAPDGESAAHLAHVAAVLGRAGAVVDSVALPLELHDANAVHRTIMLYEALGQHGARQAAQRSALSAELNAALDDARAISAEAYRNALAKRGAAMERALSLFERVDVVLTLSAPAPAPRRLDITGDPGFCTLWSLAGFPAISIPSGLSRDGVPFGVQLAAPAGADERVLSVAKWCEAQLGFEGLAE
ncbi:MAG: amidase [Burkholderiales bacterium]|nr:amidase [Burkholderiales bacterium]